jgi:hypothetical protein
VAARRIVSVVFADANVWLNSREPADANVIDLTGLQVSEPSAAELATVPPGEFFPQRGWESATAYSVVEGAHCKPLAPAEFGPALVAYIARQGGPVNLAPWVELGFERAPLEAAVANPAGTLRQALWR